MALCAGFAGSGQPSLTCIALHARVQLRPHASAAATNALLRNHQNAQLCGVADNSAQQQVHIRQRRARRQQQTSSMVATAPGKNSFGELGKVPEARRDVHFEVDRDDTNENGAPRRRGRYALLAVVLASAAYFRPKSAPAHRSMRVRVRSPEIPQKLQILTARPTHLKWRRDGALEFEADVVMRMWNDHPVPLKIRALNTTILLRSLFSKERYAVGYKTATRIKVPPKGHADVPATLVIYGLRPLMFPALWADIASEVFYALREGRRPVLNVPLEGFIKPWPAGRVDVACTLNQPLDAVGVPVTNVCRAKLL